MSFMSVKALLGTYSSLAWNGYVSASSGRCIFVTFVPLRFVFYKHKYIGVTVCLRK